MTTKVGPASGRREAAASHRMSDALGIVALAVGAIVVVALVAGDAGVLGNALGTLCRSLFGRGAWVVPPLLLITGVALLAGRGRLAAGRMVLGMTIAFIAVEAVMAESLAGDYFDPAIVAASGGYVGAIAGWALGSLLGSAKLIGAGALGMLGLILCVDVPLRAIADAIAERVQRRQLPTKPARAAKPRAIVADAEPEDEPAEAVTRPAPRVRETQTPAATQSGGPKEGYRLPPTTLLAPPTARAKRSPQEVQETIEVLESTLEEFGIAANVTEVATGPTVTRYEIQLGPGIRVGRITALADNIAMSMAASHVRIEAPIPGKSAIGVEVPMTNPATVTLREVAETKEFQDHPSRLCFALGQDVSGRNQYADLATMPHLLIGGATNSGKSIGLAAVITSLLLRNTPKDCKLVLIDPKRVEMVHFEAIPHLMCPVVRDVKEAPGVLRAVVREMDRRYDTLAEAGCRNIDTFNAKASFQDRMPYIVVVIDELADLMIQAANEVETSICRIAQLARATGIHLVVATQRPSTDVITGTIKTNIASRIAFAVSSQVDSRVILDLGGAERLVGRGDMLFRPLDAPKPVRIQGCYVSEKEIEAVADHWRAQGKPHYALQPTQAIIREREAEMREQEIDPLWEDAVRFVVERGQASTSLLQRRFSVGFQRASRLLDLMEERGIVGPRDGARPRDVLVDPMDLDSVLGRAVRRELDFSLDD